jgi:DNA-binding beta-propeller fold protein YncE
VADAARGTIIELAPNGRLLRQWGSPQLQSPLGIALDRQGDLYVTQQDSSVITKFSPAGRVLKQWGRPRLDLVTFAFPHAVAVDSAGNLFVSDWGNNRVVKIDPAGRPVAQWAMTGLGPGSFWHPLGITVDAYDHVYVVDEGGYRVEEFSSTGRFFGAWHTLSLPWLAISPESLEYNSSFGYQAGVAVDRAGNMYVTNGRDATLRKLSPAGKLVAHWKGSKAGLFSEPSGIAVGPDGTVYMADWNTGRLFKITSRIQPFIPWK